MGRPSARPGGDRPDRARVAGGVGAPGRRSSGLHGGRVSFATSAFRAATPAGRTAAVIRTWSRTLELSVRRRAGPPEQLVFRPRSRDRRPKRRSVDSAPYSEGPRPRPCAGPRLCLGSGSPLRSFSESGPIRPWPMSNWCLRGSSRQRTRSPRSGPFLNEEQNAERIRGPVFVWPIPPHVSGGGREKREEDIMPWVYSQTSGQVIQSQSGKMPPANQCWAAGSAPGYSGRGAGRNNPSMQSSVGVGPIPRGTYRIAKPRKSVKTGPHVMDLAPMGHTALGRSDFQIHGNNTRNDASRGCIILPRAMREKISGSGDTVLIVVE